MPYRLRMSTEIGDWITELCSSAPGSPESLTATEVGAALAAAMSAADPGDLAMITDLSEPADPVDDSDLRAAVDYAYQQLLEAMQQLHRAAAEERERGLTERAQSWQAAVEEFRAMKEVAKARITAAEGARQVHLAFLAAGGDPADIEQAKADLATAKASLPAAEAQAVAVLAEARRLVLAIRREVRAAEADGSDEDDGTAADSAADSAAAGDEDQAVAAGLLELRADPLGTDVRFLCAVQPPGTLTLLAVLEGQDAIHAHRDRAIGLAGELLTEIRAEDGPGEPTVASDTASGQLTFTDAATFLAELFPDSDGEVARRAADLTTANTLGVLRRQHGLSLEDLQARTGMQAQELLRLETGGLRSARLSEVAAYLRAAGVTLTVVTDDGTAIVG